MLHAPYIKGFSEGLGRKLRRLGIGFVPKKGETIYTNVCKLKQKKELEEKECYICCGVWDVWVALYWGNRTAFL